MSKLIVGIIGLVVGLVGGTVFGGSLIGGAATGIGIATGASAGICTTMQAAQEEGLLTAEQVDQVLTRAAEDLGGTAAAGSDGTLVGSAEQCEEIMQKLKDASAS